MALTFIPISGLPLSSLGIIEGEKKEVLSKASVLSWVIIYPSKSTKWGGYAAVNRWGSERECLRVQDITTTVHWNPVDAG